MERLNAMTGLKMTHVPYANSVHAVVKALKDPQLQERMLAVGAEAVGSTPTEFTAFLNKNTEQWAKVLKESGAKLGQGSQ